MIMVKGRRKSDDFDVSATSGDMSSKAHLTTASSGNHFHSINGSNNNNHKTIHISYDRSDSSVLGRVGIDRWAV